ncbi:MAG: hypothetical protein GOU99_00260 [Candidatus Altiarchaeota archaeon]|nr:hypothetical protein [Candidatus Altiarchaeota archaeon]
METRNTIRKRRTTRKYLPKDVSISSVFEVLDCGRWAPTGKGAQAWEFILVKETKHKKQLAEIAEQAWVSSAPILIVLCVNLDRAKFFVKEHTEEGVLIEAGAVAQNIMLAARDIGIASAFVGFFNRTELRKNLNCPEDVLPVGIISLGYPAEISDSKRAPLLSFIHVEEFGKPWQGKLPDKFAKKWSGNELLKLFS